jgi:hypothetical protein
MAILSLKEYRELWKEHFSEIMGGIKPPSYTDYSRRENAFENYLMRFNSTNRIKYFLIAEGPPGTGNYIYFDGSGSFCTAPINAFSDRIDTTHLEADRKLELLALAGFLVLDLFPYNITLSTSQRIRLVSSGVAQKFFRDYNNPYSIYYRLYLYNLFIPHILDFSLEINTCFMASPTINYALSSLACADLICENQFYLQPRKDLRKGQIQRRRNQGTKPIHFSDVHSRATNYPDRSLIREALMLK